MNGAAPSVIEFLRRDLAVLKRIGTKEQKEQIPLVEKELAEVEQRVAVSFATAKKADCK